MSLKAYAAGSTCPPLKDDTLRLYSMRFCPYAEKTRLVLEHLNVPHEVVNVNLKEKPEWFLVKNPLGLVPALEQGKKIVYESPICNEYLDEIYGKQSLLTTDPYERAQQKMLTERFSKVISLYYGLIRHTGEGKQQAVENLQKALDVFEEALKGKFLAGDTVKMVDYNIWPWFERFPTLQDLAGVEILTASRFPKLNAWVARMKELPAVKASAISSDLHVKFMKGYMAGGLPDYDLGL